MNNVKDEYYWNLIAAKISGHISPEEDAALKQWIDRSEANRKAFEEAVELWKSALQAKVPLSEDTIEKEWQNFQQKINTSKPAILKTGSFLSLSPVRWAIAASISAIVLTLVVVWQQAKDSWIIYESGNHVLTITLPDSSHVWLNQNSTLKVREDFTNRQVKLTGEGFFGIQRNEKSPFIVKTAQGAVTVLGTSFNVKSNDSVSIVSVLSGRVGVESGKHNMKQIGAGERASLNDRALVKEKMEISSFQDWRLMNNPQYTKELENKLNLLSVSYTWRKNVVNSSVLEGFIVNNALLTNYSTILLEVDYKRPNGKVVKTNLLLEESLKPGDSLNFTRRLFDIFSRTEDIKVKVVSASVNN